MLSVLWITLLPMRASTLEGASMIFLYIFLQSENQNINLSGVSEHLKTVF